MATLTTQTQQKYRENNRRLYTKLALYFLMLALALLPALLFGQSARLDLKINTEKRGLNAVAYRSADGTFFYETQNASDSAVINSSRGGEPYTRLRRVESTDARFPHLYSSDGEWLIHYGRRTSYEHLSGLDITNLRTGVQEHAVFGEPAETCVFDGLPWAAPFRFSSDNKHALVRVQKTISGAYVHCVADVDLKYGEVTQFLVDTAFALNQNIILLDASHETAINKTIYCYRDNLSSTFVYPIRSIDATTGAVLEYRLTSDENYGMGLSYLNPTRDSLYVLFYNNSSAIRIAFDPITMRMLKTTKLPYALREHEDVSKVVVSSNLRTLCIVSRNLTLSRSDVYLRLIDCQQEIASQQYCSSFQPTAFCYDDLGTTLYFANNIRERKCSMMDSLEDLRVPAFAQTSCTESVVSRLREMGNAEDLSFSCITGKGLVNTWRKSNGEWWLVAAGTEYSTQKADLPVDINADASQFVLRNNLVSAERMESAGTIGTSMFRYCSNHSYGYGLYKTSLLKTLANTLPEGNAIPIQAQASAFEISNDDHYAAVGHVDGTVEIVDLEVRKKVIFTRNLPASVRLICWSHNSQQLAVLCEDNKVYLISVAQSFLDYAIKAEKVSAFCYSRDDRNLYLTTLDSQLLTINCSDPLTVCQWRINCPIVRSLLCLSDGCTLVGGCEESTVQVWNVVGSVLDIGTTSLPDEKRGSNTILPITFQTQSMIGFAVKDLRSMAVFTVYNELGQSVYSQNISAESQEVVLQTSALLPGAYYCMLSSAFDYRTQAILVSR